MRYAGVFLVAFALTGGCMVPSGPVGGEDSSSAKSHGADGTYRLTLRYRTVGDTGPSFDIEGATVLLSPIAGPGEAVIEGQFVHSDYDVVEVELDVDLDTRYQIVLNEWPGDRSGRVIECDSIPIESGFATVYVFQDVHSGNWFCGTDPRSDLVVNVDLSAVDLSDIEAWLTRPEAGGVVVYVEPDVSNFDADSDSLHLRFSGALSPSQEDGSYALGGKVDSSTWFDDWRYFGCDYDGGVRFGVYAEPWADETTKTVTIVPGSYGNYDCQAPASDSEYSAAE